MDEAVLARIQQSIANGTSNLNKAPLAATRTTAASPPPIEDDGPDLITTAYDNQEALKTFGNVVVGGARDAVQGVWDTASAVAPAVSQWADRSGLNVLGMPTVPDGGKVMPTLPEVPRADESTTGGVVANMARDLERFVLGFIGGGMMLRGAGIATNTFKGAAAAGVVGDFLVTGAGDKRLVDFADHFPSLQGPLLDYLSTDGNEDLLAHKLGAAAEGVLFGTAIEGFVRFAKVIKRSISADKAGGEEAARKVLEDAQPELEAALKEIQAWHGSPHDFEKFELRPRTGEGSEAFGRGVYVAESEEVGKFYRDNTKLPPTQISADLKKAIDEADWLGFDSRQEALLAMRDHPDWRARWGTEGGEQGEVFDRLATAFEPFKDKLTLKPGNLYEVKVKHSPDDLLDWNKSIEDMPAAVRSKIEKLGRDLRGNDEIIGVGTTGEDFYRHLENHFRGSADPSGEASKALLDAGVPGLRFLDAGSRDAGEGTRNMVLFDAQSVEAISKNGKPIPKAPELNERGQIEMFPEVVRREEAIQDIQLQIKGDRYLDPETGKEKLLPISNRAREELTTAFKDPSSPLHVDKLTPETRDELLRALASDNEAARFFAPKTVRGKPFQLDDARRVDFDAALERSLTVPYATLRAEQPGVAIEDTLSTFLNYRYMDSADTVKAALDDMANVMKPMVDKHLGGSHQTFEKVQEMAEWIGMKPDTMAALLSQQARAAEYMPAIVVAAKTWVQSLTRDITQIAKQIDQGIATDTAKVELVRRQDILADLISTLKAVQTSSARTTAAGRIRTADSLSHEEIATLIKEVGEDNFKFLSRRLSLTEGNPQAVISILEPTFFQKFWGVANETWINGLLSGIGTHVINGVTGLRNTALFPAFRVTGGLLSGDMKSVRIGLGQYKAARSVVFDSLEMAKRSLLSENAYVDASFHQVERERLWVKADTFGLDGTDFLGKGIEALGVAIRMPSRFLTSEDEFLKQMNYRMSVIARAEQEAVERGLSDTKMTSYFVDGAKREISEVDQYVRDRMNEAFHPRLEHGLDQNALNDARRATFTNPLKTATWGNFQSLGEMVQQAAAKNPWIRHTILPFTRVPANIFREMIYEGPFAPTRAQFWADMKAGGEARSDALGRLALGSVFWVGGAMLASEGLITGKGPTDPALQKQWKAAGNQPYSIRFPGAGPDGNDLFVSYNRFDPTAGMLGMIADYAYISAHLDERTRDQIAMSLSLSLANNLTSRSYLRSLTELTAILGNVNSPLAIDQVERWLRSRASSYVPRIVSTLNPDDTLRDARSMLEAIEAKIPGLSAGLPPMRDNFGAPIVPAVGWPYKEVNPFAIGVGKNGAARKELAYWAESPVRAQFQMPAPSVDSVIDLRQAKNTQTGQSAYDRWMEILTEPKFAGKTAEERLDELVKSDGYKEMKAKGKEDPIYRRHPAVEFLRDQLGNHYEIAKKLMLQEPGFEDLNMALQQYEAQKHAIPLGASPPPNPTLEQLLKTR